MGDSKKLSARILLGMALGIVVGVILNFFIDTVIVKDYIVGMAFNFGSSIFTNALQMLVVPLVLFSLIVGTCDMGDVTKMGRVGVKTLALYLGSTALAIIISLTIGSLIQPGVGFNLAAYSEEIANYTPGEPTPVVDVLIGIVPKNPVKALADGNMLQIIFIALLMGVAISLIGKKVEGVKTFCIQMNELVMKLVFMVMNFAPIGVFCMAANTFAKMGFAAFKPLALYMIAAFVALFAHAIISYGGMLAAWVRVNPIRFLKNYADVVSVAFSTASSNAAMPVAMKAIVEKCGVDESISSFTIPLGTTVNMDGSAITQAMATIFIAGAYGVTLTIGDLATVVIMSTLATVGAAGVPGASMITLAMVLKQVGLPAEAIGIILGVDRILSMTRTTLNVAGDGICTMIVAKSEGLFNKDIFDGKAKAIAKKAD